MPAPNADFGCRLADGDLEMQLRDGWRPAKGIRDELLERPTRAGSQIVAVEGLGCPREQRIVHRDDRQAGIEVFRDRCRKAQSATGSLRKIGSAEMWVEPSWRPPFASIHERASE